MTKLKFYVRHRLALGATGVVLVIVAVLAVKMIIPAATSAVRLSQINGIYASLHLGNDYPVTSEAVFGDKRVYSYDKGRTMSSQKNYIHDATVDTTVADLRHKIEAAGFSFVGEPYPGSSQTQLHFKSKNSHYIRMTVSSTRRDSAARTGDMNILALYDQTHSPDEGPSAVIIKVNLDDNNE